MRTSIPKESGSVDDRFAGPIAADASADLDDAHLADLSGTPILRTWVDPGDVDLGHAGRIGGMLAFSVSPGEWIEVGEGGEGADGVDGVDLTHVRAVFRLGGEGAVRILSHLCAIDLSDEMMPNGAAARTPVAGVPSELVRDDDQDGRSFLLMMSRSFARHVWDRLTDVRLE